MASSGPRVRVSRHGSIDIGVGSAAVAAAAAAAVAAAAPSHYTTAPMTPSEAELGALVVQLQAELRGQRAEVAVWKRECLSGDREVELTHDVAELRQALDAADREKAAARAALALCEGERDAARTLLGNAFTSTSTPSDASGSGRSLFAPRTTSVRITAIAGAVRDAQLLAKELIDSTTDGLEAECSDLVARASRSGLESAAPSVDFSNEIDALARIGASVDEISRTLVAVSVALERCSSRRGPASAAAARQ